VFIPGQKFGKKKFECALRRATHDSEPVGKRSNFVVTGRITGRNKSSSNKILAYSFPCACTQHTQGKGGDQWPWARGRVNTIVKKIGSSIKNQKGPNPSPVLEISIKISRFSIYHTDEECLLKELADLSRTFGYFFIESCQFLLLNITDFDR
jgi:hypothetical protein